MTGDAFGNAVRARVFDWQRQVQRLGQPTDRGEWGMTPQTINAYYNPTFNEVVFPAAILQPPFFDPQRRSGGQLRRHRRGHRPRDGPRLRRPGRQVRRARRAAHWWQPADDARPSRSASISLAAQYDGFEALPGLNVNGRLTLGENIGDLGGLSVAMRAYHRSLHGAARRCATG